MSFHRLVLVSALLAGCSSLSSFDGSVLGESFEAKASDVVLLDKTVVISMHDLAGQCIYEEWVDERVSLLALSLRRVGPNGESLSVVPGDYVVGGAPERGATVQVASVTFFQQADAMDEDGSFVPPASRRNESPATGGMVTLGAFDAAARTAEGFLSLKFDDGELKGTFAVGSCSPGTEEPAPEPERGESWPLQRFAASWSEGVIGLAWTVEQEDSLMGFELERLGPSGPDRQTTFNANARSGLDQNPVTGYTTYRLRAVLSSGPRAWVEATAE